MESLAQTGGACRQVVGITITIKEISTSDDERIRSGVQPAFGIHLAKLIDAAFPSRRAFIRAAESGRKENPAQGYLAQVIAGTRPPPVAKLDAWIKALKLNDAEREHFLNLASLAWLPTELRPRIEKILIRSEGRQRP
jgi:hypothetical protein